MYFCSDYYLFHLYFFFFFFNDTATTEIYTLSLHDAFRSNLVPARGSRVANRPVFVTLRVPLWPRPPGSDRKSTRLNSSHQIISYAVFCLKKKKNTLINNVSKKQ